MGNLKLELNKERARHLLNCLIYPDPKGKDLDVQLEIEEVLWNYLNDIDTVEASVEETTVSSVDGGLGMDTSVSTSQKTLVFSVGIQGSGKSTYFKDKSPVIETDAIRKEVFNNVDNISNERLVFFLAMNSILQEFNDNDTVYFDATMVETQHRQSFLLELKELVPNIQLIGMLFTVSKEDAKKRIQSDLDNGIDRADSVKFVDEYFGFMQETMSLIRLGRVLFKPRFYNEDEVTPHNCVKGKCLLGLTKQGDPSYACDESCYFSTKDGQKTIMDYKDRYPNEYKESINDGDI